MKETYANLFEEITSTILCSIMMCVIIASENSFIMVFLLRYSLSRVAKISFCIIVTSCCYHGNANEFQMQ